MSDSPRSHDDLFLSLLRAGDERALTVLFDSYYDLMVGAVEPYVSDPHDADDIVHLLFWEIWKNRSRLRVTRPVHRYLLKSALNRARNKLRERSRRPEVLKSPDDMRMLDSLQLDKPADTGLNVADIQRLLGVAKARMSSRVRLTYSLSRTRGLTYLQMAEWMGVSTKAVEKNMSVALKILNEVFAPYIKIVIISVSYGLC